tara:strand:- start:8454 stop:8822 length:369 start_codon:yes stop_codon:yes gene_type:complete
MKSQIEAKITEIRLNEKFVDIIITRKSNNRFFPLCFVGFSETIESIKNQGIEKTDKVKINFTARSKKRVSKENKEWYSTSLIIDNIELLEKKSSIQTELVYVDSNTGEIVENVDSNYNSNNN